MVLAGICPWPLGYIRLSPAGSSVFTSTPNLVGTPSSLLLYPPLSGKRGFHYFYYTLSFYTLAFLTWFSDNALFHCYILFCFFTSSHTHMASFFSNLWSSAYVWCSFHFLFTWESYLDLLDTLPDTILHFYCIHQCYIMIHIISFRSTWVQMCLNTP